MSSDAINRINFQRALYKSQEVGSPSQEVRVLQQIKHELKISNDEKAREDNQITNATHSPYLPDQLFYKKDVVHNSTEETSWREVKSAEKSLEDAREQYLQSNRKKLNIL
ncbi:MAG: hypothetical protein EHM20_02905 [Alphaproteobacteria bacterium]|nr:MAG: hypothetical protein EHM20_02905 [Alphaproteobacteria bacterium]